MRSEEQTVNYLLSAALSIAPSSIVGSRFSEIVDEMRNEGEANTEIAKVLSGGIYDGLAYGNWPTLKKRVNE